MKHIELLTIESYLEAKKEVIENINCEFDKLHIDHVEELEEILEEMKEVYFGEEEECKVQNSNPVKFLKGNGSYIEVNATSYVGRDVFLKGIKDKYRQLKEENRELEIVEEIEKALSFEFMNSCKLSGGQMKRIYEIIKYTLSEEKFCDYLDNGKFMREMSEKDIFPFKIKVIKELKCEGLPVYCQKMQRVLFGVHRKIFMNPKDCAQSLDITRFSFYNVRKIVDTVTKALIEENGDYKEDSKDYISGYIEGVEDYILLDEILGISLTNIVYWKTKEIEKREIQEDIAEIVSYLASCHYDAGRNAVAQVLFDYLQSTDYDRKIIQKVSKILKKEVKGWNEYYEEVEAVMLCPLFKYLKECSVNDLIEVCKGIESKREWGEYIYMEEIGENEVLKIKMIKGHEKEDKIRIPKGRMDKRTWYAYIHKTVFEAIWS